MSRDKGARSERALRDELRRRGWSDVIRVPLSGAVKTREQYQDDVVGRPPGYAQEIRFENKARRTGFDSYYALVTDENDSIACAFPEGDAVVVTLNPDVALEVAIHIPLQEFTLPQQKALRSLQKKCRDWIGNAQILSLKQDRKPFLYARYRR